MNRVAQRKMSKKEKDLEAQRMADLTFELLERCRAKQEKLASNLRLTVAEFKLLRSFRDSEHAAVGELARRMELSSSRLTRILDGLVRKRIVTREAAASDRRVWEVRLTRNGTKLQQELERTFIQTHQHILDSLPAGASPSVLLAMQKLSQAMRKWNKQ